MRAARARSAVPTISRRRSASISSPARSAATRCRAGSRSVWAIRARIEGAIEAESLEAPAVVAAAIGMPAQRGGEQAGPRSRSSGARRALPGGSNSSRNARCCCPVVAAQQLSGVARFNAAEIVFEDIAGEMAKGRLEGRLAVANGSDGMSARASLCAGRRRSRRAVRRRGAAGDGGQALSMQTELEGAGRSPAAFIGSLTGFGNVTLEQRAARRAQSRCVRCGEPRDRAWRSARAATGFANSSPACSTTRRCRWRGLRPRIGISAGQARFSDISVQSTGAELQASASVDLADATLDARLTLNGLPPSPGAQRPAVLVCVERRAAVAAAHGRHQPADKLADAARRRTAIAADRCDGAGGARCRHAGQSDERYARPSGGSPAPVAPDAPSVVPGNADSPAQARRRRRCRRRSTSHRASRIAKRAAGRGPAPPRGGPRAARPTRRAELTPAAAQSRRMSRGNRRLLRCDTASAVVIEHEQPDRRRQIAVAAVGIDRRHKLGQSEAAIVGDFLEALPERVFETDAGLVSSDNDGALDNRRFHRRSPGSIRC